MSWLITDLTGRTTDVVQPTEAEAVLVLEDMLEQHIHDGYVVHTNNDVHTVSTPGGDVLHVYRIRPGYDE